MLANTRLCRAGSSAAVRGTACRQCGTSRQLAACRQHPARFVIVASAPADPPATSVDEGEDFEGLLPEEDVTVPGSLQDALNPNTKLGKAVKSAVEELEHLNKLEADLMAEYNSKLQQLGIPLDIFTMPTTPADEQPEDDAELPPPEEGPAAGGSSKLTSS